MTDRRVMPHHAEAEASILGGIILRRENLAALGHVEVDDFYDNRHRAVFAAIRNLDAASQPIDVVTLENEIEKAGKLDAIGGVAFLGELTLRVPTADNVAAYAQIVRQQSMLRTLMLKGGAVAEAGYNFADDPDELLDETIADLQRLQRDHRGPAKVPPGFAAMPTRAGGEREERLAAAARALRYHNAYLDDGWWALMLEADARVRAAGIEQNAPPMPKSCAGENERNLNACEKLLLEGGDDAETVDRKLRHLIAYRERECIRDRTRRWLSPAALWDPKRANYAFDRPLDEADKSPMARAGPRSSAGRAEPQTIRPKHTDDDAPPIPSWSKA